MKIAFQGAHGAYSDMACRQLFPRQITLPCLTFDDAFEAVQTGNADLAVIPIENTLAGRVADVHHLLPDSGLHIIGEHFLPVNHCLLGTKDSDINTLTHVHSHVHALPQCRKFLRSKTLQAVVHSDTAGAAAEIAAKNDPTQAAIASKLAAEIYDLAVLKENVQDSDNNTTRFVILSPKESVPEPGDAGCLTSFIFDVRHIPAALYKAVGGFATNGVNMIKLESYVDSTFNAARFYCEVEGHPQDTSMILAMEELAFFARNVKIMGTYPKSGLRETLAKPLT